MLPIRADNRVGRLQRLHDADGNGFLAVVEMQKAADLRRRCTAPRNDPRSTNAQHLRQQVQRVLAACSASEVALMRCWLQRRQIAFRQPERTARSRRRMILPLRVRGSDGVNSISRGAIAAPSSRRPCATVERSASRLVAGLELDDRFHDLADDRVGQTDHGGLQHGRMQVQRALDLERTDQMAGRLDDVVAAADEPEIAARIAPRLVAGEVPAVREALAIALLVVEVALNIDGQSGRSAISPSSSAEQLDRAVLPAPRDGDLDARHCQPHRAGPDRGEEVGDHDRAGLGLPPGVVHRQTERIDAPRDRLGIQRLADA